MKKSKKKTGQVVSFNVDQDLKEFNTTSKQLIRDEAPKVSEENASGETDEQQVLKNLFVTQEEDAMEEFEKEKQGDIEGQIGTKVKKVDIHRGWNEWAGDGVDTSKHEARKKKAEEIRSSKIDEIKKQRQDAKLRGV